MLTHAKNYEFECGFELQKNIRKLTVRKKGAASTAIALNSSSEKFTPIIKRKTETTTTTKKTLQKLRGTEHNTVLYIGSCGNNHQQRMPATATTATTTKGTTKARNEFSDHATRSTSQT